MPYILGAMLIAAFASGFGVSHQLNKSEIKELSDGIAMLHREAEATIATLTKEADEAHDKALNANKQLEDANVSAIKAINSQRDSFKPKRMYDTYRKSSSCPSTAGSSASNATEPNDDRHELSDEFTAFLKSEAYRADEISNYAILCQKFVVDNNCGITR